MRGAFGLVSILVCTFIAVYLWSEHTKGVSRANKALQPTVGRVAVNTPGGTNTKDSIALAAYAPNGSLRGLLVQGIIPGGPMDVDYGLLPGDIIQEIGEFKIGDSTSIVSDEESARSYLLIDAYRGKYPLAVDRGGKTIKLPADRTTPAPAPTGPGPTGAGKTVTDLINTIPTR